MNEDGQFTNQTENSTQQWLNSYAPPPVKPRKPIKNILITTFLGIAIILIGLVMFIVFNRAKPCLTTYDFKDLTGLSLDGQINSKEDFYTFNIKFNSQTTDYNNSDDAEEVTVEKVGQFYNAHKDKSIIISLSGNYPTNTSNELATKRLEKMQDDLKRAGLPTNMIKTNTPTTYEPDIDEGEADTLTTVAITSANKCSE